MRGAARLLALAAMITTIARARVDAAPTDAVAAAHDSGATADSALTPVWSLVVADSGRRAEIIVNC